MRLLRRAAALLEVAGRAGRRDIFPGRPPAGAARNDMVEGQVVRGAAILAGELVAQEQVEPGEGGMFRRLHILLQRDHRWELHRKARAVDLPLITGDAVHQIQKNKQEARRERKKWTSTCNSRW